MAPPTARDRANVLPTVFWLIVLAATLGLVPGRPDVAQAGPWTTGAPTKGGPRTGLAAPEAADRAAVEAAVLASTVRLELAVLAPDPTGSFRPEQIEVSHATVLEGRYLLTHAHFRMALAEQEDGRRRQVTVLASDGRALLRSAPFSAFSAVNAGPEGTLLDFGLYGDVGLFAFLGVPSARLGGPDAAGVRPGDLVAQVDWDGAATRVDWVRVVDVRQERGALVLELDDDVAHGASGGGVYYEGAHVANTWARRREETVAGAVLRRTSLAAINSAFLFAPGLAASTPPGAEDAQGKP